MIQVSWLCFSLALETSAVWGQGMLGLGLGSVCWFWVVYHAPLQDNTPHYKLQREP